MIMEAVLYFTVKAACAVYVLSHLWTFIFGRRMYGIWERLFRLMRIVRIRLWKHRRKHIGQAERNTSEKTKCKKPETRTDVSREKPGPDMPPSSPTDDDVIGKTKSVYLEDPNTMKSVPVRSEPMEKVPIEEDGDISPDDVEQENKGLTAEDREELMAPVDVEPDPDFSTALTFEEINNVAEVLVSDIPDEQKAVRAAATIHHKMQETVILSFLTDKLCNQEKVSRLLNEYLDESGRPLAKRKFTSKRIDTFNIDEFV